jgi:hypothetical protein
MYQFGNRNALVLVFIICLLAAPLPRALAQGGFPNLVGTYATAGGWSWVNCEDLGLPMTTFPIYAELTVTSQEGNHFQGTLFDDGQGGSFISFQGTVNEAGDFSGTWDLTNTPNEGLFNQTFGGRIEGTNLTIDFVAEFGIKGEPACGLLIALSSGAVLLTWTAPDAASGEELPPPRDLIVAPLELPKRRDATETQPAPPGAVTGYKVYRSSQPNVQPSPNNIFATLPPNQTAVPAASGLRGSYFVVTACYAAGESAPSNEVVASATPGPVVTNFTPTNKKLTFTGTGFVPGTTLQINGVGFVALPKIKPDTKFTQKGKLTNGLNIKKALAQPGALQLTFRTPDGGITNLVVQ